MRHRDESNGPDAFQLNAVCVLMAIIGSTAVTAFLKIIVG